MLLLLLCLLNLLCYFTYSKYSICQILKVLDLCLSKSAWLWGNCIKKGHREFHSSSQTGSIPWFISHINHQIASMAVTSHHWDQTQTGTQNWNEKAPHHSTSNPFLILFLRTWHVHLDTESLGSWFLQVIQIRIVFHLKVLGHRWKQKNDFLVGIKFLI